MKVRTFNLLLSNHKGQTKVIVKTENDLFKIGSVWTANELNLTMLEKLDDLNPYPLNTTLKKRDYYYQFREEFKEKIIKSLELKNK